MYISVSEGKAKFLDLVRRAEAGEEIVLTRHGHSVATVNGIHSKPSAESLRARRLSAIDRAVAAAKTRERDGGASAARSQDCLYGDDGLPA